MWRTQVLGCPLTCLSVKAGLPEKHLYAVILNGPEMANHFVGLHGATGCSFCSLQVSQKSGSDGECPTRGPSSHFRALGEASCQLQILSCKPLMSACLRQAYLKTRASVQVHLKNEKCEPPEHCGLFFTGFSNTQGFSWSQHVFCQYEIGQVNLNYSSGTDH